MEIFFRNETPKSTHFSVGTLRKYKFLKIKTNRGEVLRGFEILLVRNSFCFTQLRRAYIQHRSVHMCFAGMSHTGGLSKRESANGRFCGVRTEQRCRSGVAGRLRLPGLSSAMPDQEAPSAMALAGAVGE
jgi:hypothetical protein